MRFRPHISTAVIVLIIWTFPIHAILLAQQPGQTPSFRTTSRLVLVDVVVKDKKHLFMTGLSAKDFEVFEDGVRQQIVSVTLNQSPGAGPAQSSGAVNPPGTFLTRELPDSILLLDLLNTEPKDRPYARQAMLQYIENHLQPGQEVAVFVLAGKLMLLQDFTADSTLLKTAIEKDRSNTLDPKINDRDADELERIAYMTNDGILMRMVEVLRRFEANLVLEKTSSRVEATLQALRSITRTAGGRAGRKSLVWVSGAFPLTLLSETGPISRIKELNSFEVPMKETSNLLNNAQIAVYPVDVRGLLALSPIPMEQSQSALWVRDPKRYKEKTDRVPQEIQGPQEAMKELAELTGGLAFYNRNDLDKAIKLAIEDNAQSYTIAYIPTNRKYNGKFRKIAVKPQIAGAQLRYRRGYFALDSNQLSRVGSPRDLLSALERDAGRSTQIDVMARPEPDNPVAGGDFKVHIFVNGSNVEFWNKEPGMTAALDFGALAIDEKGLVVASVSHQGEITLTAADMAKVAGSGLLYTLKLKLPKGRLLLRAGVKDRSTGLIGSAEFPVTVP